MLYRSMKDVIRYNLKQVMDARGVKNIDLANALGISKSAVSNWMSGRNSIDIDHIPSICKLLDIEPGALFDDNSEHSRMLNKDEMRLLNAYRRMDSRARYDMIVIAESLLNGSIGGAA